MKVSELWRLLTKVHSGGPDEDIGGGGGGILPGEPLTQIVGDDGGIGYEGPGNAPIFAFRLDGDTHDRITVWVDGSVFLGRGDSPPHNVIHPIDGGAEVSPTGTLLLNAGGGGLVSISRAFGTLAFFDVPGSGQPAAIADATDPASTEARLNDLLAAMRALGLIAT